MSADKKKKSGATLGIILILVYAGVLLGTLKYTGVIKFPAKKKTNVANEQTDKKDKSGSTTTTTAAGTGSETTTTTTTTILTTTTTSEDRATGEDQSTDKLKRLVKIYEAMDPGQAAIIMSKLTDSEAVSILSAMDEEIAAEVLSAMDTDRAATLSKKLGL
jgi:flagellar motility protein MotE (MotC chaperone)